MARLSMENVRILVNDCCPGAIINSICFHSPERPDLDNKLYGHPNGVQNDQNNNGKTKVFYICKKNGNCNICSLDGMLWFRYFYVIVTC